MEVVLRWTCWDYNLPLPKDGKLAQQCNTSIDCANLAEEIIGLDLRCVCATKRSDLPPRITLS